jgi:hypothetical protein
MLHRTFDPILVHVQSPLLVRQSFILHNYGGGLGLILLIVVLVLLFRR